MRISDWSSDVCSSDLHDPQCRVVPLWRNQHLIAAEAEAVGLRLADLEGLLESPPPEWGEAIFLGLREEVAYVAIDFSRLEEPQIGPLTAGRGSFQDLRAVGPRSEEHTSELQTLMRNSYAVFCLKTKTN